jgi:hypothetical protein
LNAKGSSNRGRSLSFTPRLFPRALLVAVAAFRPDIEIIGE